MRKLSSYIPRFMIFLAMAILFSCTENKGLKTTDFKTDAFKITPPVDQVVSDSFIEIDFKKFDKNTFKEVNLMISGTYGTTILPAQLNGEQLQFKIPKELSTRAGILEWLLIAHQNTIQRGTFRLLPNTKALKTIENYIGPRSIISNERDYTMLVSIPVDSLDNMLPDGTTVAMRQQFKGNIKTITEEVASGFTWHNIKAPLTTGRLITGSTLEQISSKELVVDIFPDIAVPFKIFEDSNHNYADGNEMITLKTDQIKDTYGNVMTDGTLVTFFIKDSFNNRWQTTASTVNGYAFAKALHPQTPSTWTVKGIITGMVESPELNIDFKSIINKIPVSLVEENTVIVGPLTSYLGQLVPNGIAVKLKLNGKEITLRTKNGIVKHTYDTKIITPDTYKLEIESLGITSIKSITLR